MWAIPVFGLLIFIHELGHFAVAKYFDIRVHEFALGFGPVLAGFDRGETRYNLRAVPLGGFVRMAGMEEADADDPRGFNQKSILARSLVIAAGPVMNFILAALMYSLFLFLIGTSQNTPVLGAVPEQCDTVAAGQPVTRECPAHAAGLQKGDRVLSINGQPITVWEDILRVVTASEGKTLAFQVQRGQETREVSVQPFFSDDRWLVGIQPSTAPLPLGEALVQGPVMTYRISGAWISGIVGMLTGEIEPELSGPVGITRAIAEEASRGWDNLMLLTAFLSINLGWFNLLPIPALDGSRLVFMGVELVRGRRLDPRRESMVHFVGFLLLIGLMLVTTYSDFARR